MELTLGAVLPAIADLAKQSPPWNQGGRISGQASPNFGGDPIALLGRMTIAALAGALALALGGCGARADGEACRWERLDPSIYDVRVEPASFRQGAPDGTDLRLGLLPGYEATVSRPFNVMVREVLRSEWEAAFRQLDYVDPGCGADCPAVALSWAQSVALANAFSDRDGLERCYDLSPCEGEPSERFGFRCPSDLSFDLDCRGWRLPTSTEWELAARGGTTAWSICSDDLYNTCIFKYAHAGSSAFDGEQSFLAPAGTRCPNGFGLVDVFGNAEEWVWDSVDADTGSTCRSDGEIDPKGCDDGSAHIARGGSYRLATIRLLGSAGGTGYGPGWEATWPVHGVRFVRTVD